MGWKTSTIIITKSAEMEHELVLTKLGFTKLIKSGIEPYEIAMYPEKGKVYIGTYNENLILCVDDLPMKLIEIDDSPFEHRIIQQFPDSEICALVLHSVVNLWGYAVIKNGTKIRARAGSSDDGTYIEKGEPVEEEIELLNQSKLDKNGNRVYLLNSFPGETFTEDQVGENFVFLICKRYIGEVLDCADDFIFNTNLTEYCYELSDYVKSDESEKKHKSTDKPWWKLWK